MCLEKVKFDSVDFPTYIGSLSDNDFTPNNIKKDVNIFGVIGTYEGDGITPTGTLNITSNGTYNVTNYASADVDVPGEVIPDHTDTNFALSCNATGSNGLIVNYFCSEKSSFNETHGDYYPIDTIYDSNFIGDNIKKGTTIFGRIGTYTAKPSTCILKYTDGIEVLAALYSDGNTTQTWGSEPDDPYTSEFEVACNTPIVFYYPMGPDVPQIVIHISSGGYISAYAELPNGYNVFSIPKQFENQTLYIQWV